MPPLQQSGPQCAVYPGCRAGPSCAPLLRGVPCSYSIIAPSSGPALLTQGRTRRGPPSCQLYLPAQALAQCVGTDGAPPGVHCARPSTCGVPWEGGALPARAVGLGRVRGRHGAVAVALGLGLVAGSFTAYELLPALLPTAKVLAGVPGAGQSWAPGGAAAPWGAAAPGEQQP